MATYSVAFSAVASTLGNKDLFDILSSTVSGFRVSHVAVWKSTQGSTEGAAIQVIACSSALASAGGSTIAVARLDSRSSATASFTGLMNSTTPGSSGGADARLLYAGALNDSAPFVWTPPRGPGFDERPVLGKPGLTTPLQERLQVRIGVVAAAVTVSGTVILEEIGKT